MEIPFYYSFKNFEKNYRNDLDKWLKNYPDATEKDFLSELKIKYEPYVRWSGKYHFKDINADVILKENPFDRNEDFITSITLQELCKIINNRFNYFFNSIPFSKEDFEYKPLSRILNDCEILDIIYYGEYKGSIDGEYRESIYGEHDEYKINYKSIRGLENFTFFNLDKESDFEPFFCFDENKYKNFGYSVVRIADWIDEKIKKFYSFNKIQTPQTETLEPAKLPDYDYSGKNELKPKEKLILLDKLGIIKFLTNKLDVSDNATHLAEILGAITGIDNQKGTLTGYCNYLIRPDHGNKNSPYFSETTVKRANQIYNTFNIKDKTD